MSRITGLGGCIVAATAALIAAPALADVKAGVDAWQRGDYAGAVSIWRPLAIAGDADAQFNMGQAYKLGRGVPADLRQAESWYRQAALSGHEQAEDNYGLVLFQNGRSADAMPWLERSVARGEPRAQYILGTALFNGDFVGKDWVRAYALMTRASSAGLAQASQALAQMDQHIPLADRQRGIAMAREVELAAAKTQPLPSPIIKTEVPPSKADVTAGTTYQAPPATPVRTAAVAKPAPAPAPAKPAAKPAPVAAKGDWRIQLGAFSEKARADALWASLKPKVGGLSGLEHFTVKAGAVTRLQAGPFATKAAADKQCSAVRAAGQPCLTLKI